MRPARLYRAMAPPTWFGRAPLHAAAISCCVLPFAKASTCSLRVDEVRLPPAGSSALAQLRRFEHFKVPKWLRLLRPTPEGRHYSGIGGTGPAVILGGG